MKTKTFDSVNMKQDCQQKIREEFKGKSGIEEKQELEKWLESSEDKLARFWRGLHLASNN